MLKAMSKKRRVSLLLVGFLLLGTIIFALTYAYYAAFIGPDAETEVNISGDTLDSLVFIDGDPLSLVMTQQNMAKGNGSISASSTSSVSLIANETTNTATQTYNVYLDILSNNFVYSTGETKTPEVVLKIEGPDGEITSIDGLSYGTTNGVTGFDVTERTDDITIKLDQSITSNSSSSATVQDYTITLTIVNLDTSQNINAGKEFSAKLSLQQPKKLTDALLSIHNESNGLVQHSPEKTTSAGDNNYRYSGGNDVVQNYICFGSDEEVCPKESLYRILGIYNIEGEQLVKIIKAHPIDKNKDGIYEVGISQADTFAFDGTTSDDADNRWEGANTTEASDDADINKYLNGEYLNELPTKYQEMIELVKYKVGGIPWDPSYKPKNFYQSEISIETEQKYKIGLMNISDYLYGASESYWGLLNRETTEPHNDSYYMNEEIKDNNWMYLREYESQYYTEWTIGSHSARENLNWFAHYYGNVNNHDTYYGPASRPISYLKSAVVLSSGVGTEVDPFRISL